MHKWRLIIENKNDAYYNMAVDEAIMKIHSQGETPPTLRFYGWKPAALSLGYFQQARKEVNFEKCQQQGIDLVRRLTGGRAILHDRELTYSIVIREDYKLLADSIEKSYQQISRGLVAGLNQLGIEAELKAVEKGQKAPRGHSAACFDAPSWYEVILNNKKLIGSAQRRKNNTILQHGSLPLEIEADKIFKFLNYDSERQREKARRVFAAKSTSLKKAGYYFSEKKLKRALAQGLEQALEINLEKDKLTESEKKLALKLAEEKYKSKKWTYKR
ncbi:MULTISPECIES: lipoate--protein ligase family protein [Halanaerobium]|uniref:Lipoate-protein ligase A n=1 Tax=Halanaerobium kushneri TaxID=56779 RepID=A0A1N6XPY9_9FIRM|nr:MULTISPECIES: biotin/lipoate A/B protein ligase family protein [Halanaerobium]RCW54896.1 lipoate-protein ligase A [Halanaerobium sp. ST460_2HS_T2]SIR04289.1 lipoate-protein ligase A [Halanaerobium kushneri]